MPWITPELNYYDGRGPVAVGSVMCAKRPSTAYTLTATWQTNPTDPAVCWRLKTQTEIDAENEAELNSEMNTKKLLRLQFEIDYDQESRLRVIEGRPAITKTQYRNALIATYKTL